MFTNADCSTIFKSKIEARPINAGHYMAFKHRISFATDLAANFGDSQNRMFQIESIQNQDSIWNMWFCSYVIILLRDQ